ncbi:MAG: methyl-accepting chemotaxis protein, partial [Firmicutes bacterium]|nr:methyl-accepting chemotaxis protein [Bacillota bacterium]
MKLSQRITLFVSTLLLATIVGLGVTALQITSNSILEQTKNTLVTTAQEGAQLVEAMLGRELRVLEELARRSEVQSMSWARQRQSLLPDVERLGYLDIGITTPDGTATYVLTEETAWIGDRVHFQKAMEGASHISNVMISRVENRPVVIFAVPIVQNDEVVGVLVARKDAKEFSHIVDQMGYGGSGYAFILGADGTFYAHPDETRVLEQHNVLKDIETDGELKSIGLAFQKLGLNKTGFISYQLKDAEIFMGVAPINNTDWVFAEGAPRSEIVGWVDELRNAFVIGAAVFLGLGVAASIFIGQSISRPIVALAGVLERLSQYDLTLDKTSDAITYIERKDEVGQIANSLATMQTNLLTLIQQIQEKAERVAAFSQELTATSEESSASAMEVARAIQEIASGASDQASETEKGATQVVEIGDTIVHNQGLLQAVNALAEKIVALKDEGLQIMDILMTQTRESV